MIDIKVFDSKGNTMEIQQTPDQKWFGFCRQTNEYTPAFMSFKNLMRMIKEKGFEVEDV